MLHRFKIRAVAVSPDGRTVSLGSEDKMARLSDAVTNRPIGLPLIHQGPVADVPSAPTARAFSPPVATTRCVSGMRTPGNLTG